MRDITADEIDLVNGGDMNEFFNQARSMFQSWFGQPPQQNQPNQLSAAQLQQLASQCIAAGGNWSQNTTSGSFSFEFMGMRVGGGNASGSASNQGYSCTFYV